MTLTRPHNVTLKMNAHPRTGTLSAAEIADARADIAAQLRDADTVPVTFAVTDLRRLHSAGSLLAIATLELNLGGIELNPQRRSSRAHSRRQASGQGTSSSPADGPVGAVPHAAR
jgi:hypothetical protein